MKNNSVAKKVALSGVLGALTVVCLFLAAYMPTGRLGFYVLSSFISSVIIMELGISSGWLFYVSTGLLSLIIVPDKLGIWPYILFFGIYGIIKFYIEKLDKIVPEIILKLVFFNICLGAAYILIKQIFSDTINTGLPWFVLLIIAEAAFVLYDYLFSLFTAYYRDKLKKILKT